MTGTPYYNKSVRKLVVAFTTLFNNIHIERETAVGAVDATLKVPITISDKAKWYSKLYEDLGNTSSTPKSISRTLPRMGVDLVGMRYDSQRTGITTTHHVADVPALDSSSSSNANYYTERKKSYRRMPYTYDFELLIATKTMTDSLMILEQILPFFKPDLSVTINDHATLNIETDVSVTLKDVVRESTRRESFDELDLLTWTIGFELKGYVYSPVSDRGVILSTDINLYDKMPADNPNRVAVIEADVVAETEFDIDDLDSYTNVITEFDYYTSSSSSS